MRCCLVATTLAVTATRTASVRDEYWAVDGDVGGVAAATSNRSARQVTAQNLSSMGPIALVERGGTGAVELGKDAGQHYQEEMVSEQRQRWKQGGRGGEHEGGDGGGASGQKGWGGSGVGCGGSGKGGKGGGGCKPTFDRTIDELEYLFKTENGGVLFHGSSGNAIDKYAIPTGTSYKSFTLMTSELMQAGVEASFLGHSCGVVVRPNNVIAGSARDLHSPTTRTLWNQCSEITKIPWRWKSSVHDHVYQILVLHFRPWLKMKKVDLNRNDERLLFAKMAMLDDQRYDAVIEHILTLSEQKARWSWAWERIAQIWRQIRYILPVRTDDSGCFLTNLFLTVMEASDSLLKEGATVMQFGRASGPPILPIRKFNQEGDDDWLAYSKLISSDAMQDITTAKEHKTTEIVAVPQPTDLLACVQLNMSQPCAYEPSECHGKEIKFDTLRSKWLQVPL